MLRMAPPSILLANHPTTRIRAGGQWGNLMEAMIMAETELIIHKVRIKTRQDLDLIVLVRAKENLIHS